MLNAEYHKPLFHSTTPVSWKFLGFPTLTVANNMCFDRSG